MEIGGFTIDAEALWIIVGVVLLCVEMIAPGLYLAFLGAAAIFTGLLGYALPLPLGLEFLVFAIASVISVFAAKRWLDVYPILSNAPLLNARIAQMIGQTVVVVDAIEDGEGRVKVGDGVWSASGPDAEVGAKMRITGAEGNCLEVEPIATLSKH